MKKGIILILLVAAICFGDTTYVSGTVSGVWDISGNPYIVTGDLEVSTGDSLIIGPGVDVLFSGYFSINVRDSALFKAIGTETDSVRFTVGDTATGHYGIEFNYAAAGCSLIYCAFEYAEYKGAVSSDNTTLFISNCLFEHNRAAYGGAICIHNSVIRYDSTIIQNSVFTDDSSYAVSYRKSRDNTIQNCVFDSNYGALLFGDGSYFNSVANCIFRDNLSEITVGGDRYSLTYILNSIFKDNLSDYELYTQGGRFYIANTLIDPQKCRFWYRYGTGTYDYYLWFSIINTDPLFAGDFTLSPNSPCIDAGRDSVYFAALFSGYAKAPDFDFNGNPRPQGGGIDLGAFESPYFPPNRPPNIALFPNDMLIQIPVTFRKELWVTEVDGDSVTIEIVGAPGAYIENDSFFVWEPTSTDAGTTEVMVIASDGELADTASFTYIIWSYSPRFMYCPVNQTISPGDTFQEYIYVYDPDGESLDYDFKMPLGAEVIGDTQIVWIPEIGGEYWFHVRVCDPYTCDQCSFQVLVGTPVSGEVCGVWDKENNNYYINGDVTVAPGCSLIINSGVNIQFIGLFGISIDSCAVFKAIGSLDDSIHFSCAGCEFHSGLSFYKSVSCSLNYIDITEGKKVYGGAINCYNTDIVISNSYFHKCYGISAGGAVCVENSDILIENTLFKYNSTRSTRDGSLSSGGGVYLILSNGIIVNSNFYGNSCHGRSMYYTGRSKGGGLYAENSSYLDIISCLFMFNASWGGWSDYGPGYGRGGGIYTVNCSLLIENSLFYNNFAEGFGGALYSNDNSFYSINNTITQNRVSAPEYGEAEGSGIATNGGCVFNSLIFNNVWGIADYYYSLIDSTDIPESALFHEGVIFDNPFFADSLYHLSDSSLCIDAGAEYIVYEGDTIWAPLFDIEGNARPCSLGWDIGCYEFWPDTSSDTTEPDTTEPDTTIQNPETFHLTVYPNPFNSAVYISTHSESVVEVFNISGKKVTRIPSGEYIWKPEDRIGSGIYLVRSSLENRTIEKKLVYLK